MLLKPSRLRYQWFYEPQQQVLFFCPLWQDFEVTAKNLLFKIFKSLELNTCLALLNGDKGTFECYECLADEQEFLNLIQKLRPKWVASFGELNIKYPGIYVFPHPNIWQEQSHLKKRIWLACHDLKHKVL